MSQICRQQSCRSFALQFPPFIPLIVRLVHGRLAITSGEQERQMVPCISISSSPLASSNRLYFRDGEQRANSTSMAHMVPLSLRRYSRLDVNVQHIHRLDVQGRSFSQIKRPQDERFWRRELGRGAGAFVPSPGPGASAKRRLRAVT